MCLLDDANDAYNRVLALASRPIVYAKCVDRPSGISLPMPNLSKLNRLVWPKCMLPIKFFHTGKNFPSISPLEKLIVAKSCEKIL